MPQFDRYKHRQVDIEFAAVEDFDGLPYPERNSLVMVTSGSIRGNLNGRPIAIEAPGVLCLAADDELDIVIKENVAAQSFSFHSDFLITVRLPEAKGYIPTGARIQVGRSFFETKPHTVRVPPITKQAFTQLFEWFFVMGMEVQAQSDALWACRVKKYFIQIMGLLEDLNRSRGHSPVDAVLEYIHTHYSQKIAAEDLTNCAHLNRVTLNKQFQDRCGTTAIGYLLAHRLIVAGNMLTHTDMSLNEIARATGFEYDTYFIKQFTAKRGMSPSAYRSATRKFAAEQ
ncbi:AraC family transcriptional regulator [Paenibacillus sp. NFR01]|uniref:AraC family transcriptional regulator n=1 Tax=Paenibacillus sp. NFR01 TaxID=1566279 RepID=UPI0008BB07AE|nr:AraC family transcriptional regulator [Paenibacillus sp. NFR01]SET27390.1 AraC-type DNA-binding protein [Paenibacillus sp. NFR01]